MGQAKIKNNLIAQVRSKVDIDRLSNAVQKVFVAGSSHLGADCFVHAHMASQLINELGVKARIVVGGAAWRVGPAVHEVISHTPLVLNQLPQDGNVPYHAWVEINEGGSELILDLTTYSLPTKARALDAMDGCQTSIHWAPPYVLCSKASTSSFSSVEDSTRPGLFYYSEDPITGPKMVEEVLRHDVDAEYYFALKQIYANPAITLIGPESVRA